MMEIDFETARFNAIEQQIRPWHIHDLEVLDKLKQTPREEFVLPSQKGVAFSDTELALPFDNRFLLSPKVEARILQAVRPNLKGNVLIIGSDLGYLPCVLMSFNQQVSILDENQELLNLAQANLQKYKLRVSLIHQPFIKKINQSFNTIIVTASIDKVYPEWLKSLENNGELIAFIGNAPILEAKKFTKINNTISTLHLFETWVNRLPNMPVSSSFYF